MPLESPAQTAAATDLRNGVSPKSRRRGVGPKPSASLLTRLGLMFDDPAVEDQYRAVFAEYAIYRTRIAMGLAVVTNAVFGIWDLTSTSGGLMSTRFRYMVAFPAFAIFFAGSFHRSMKRWWQEYSVLFCIFFTVCMFHSVVLFDLETEFKIAPRNRTFHFQLSPPFRA